MTRLLRGIRAKPLKRLAVVVITCIACLIFSEYRDLAGLDHDAPAHNRDEFRGSRRKSAVAANQSAPPAQKWKTIAPRTARPADSVLHSDQEVSKVLSQKLFYNRVPKCGSTAAQQIFIWLRFNRKLTYKVLRVYNRYKISVSEQKKLAESVAGWDAPLLVDRHVYFVNFTSFTGQPMPSYINVIRDPLERLVSYYYFTMNGRKGSKTHVRPGDKDYRRWNLTLDECLALAPQDGRCPDVHSVFNQVVEFFCGQADECVARDSRSLAIAKSNVEKYYPVIGRMEDMDSFFRVLEATWPAMFKDAYTGYSQSKSKLYEKYSTKGKIPPSPATAQLLKRKLALEYDLYHFILGRYDSMLSSAGNKGL